MLKKIFIFLFCLFCFSSSALAKDRYIYFVEDCGYKDLYRYENIQRILDNSVKGLAIQRGGGCELSFFKGILKKRPSNLSINEVPLYNNEENIENIFLKGYVELGGTLYVPSKILVYGQTYNNNITKNKKVFIEHVPDLQKLDKEIGNIQDNEDVEIIISSWSKSSRNKLENYIMPVTYYDNKNKGIFYSLSTRNRGILDYENINDILSGNISKLKIVDGNINEIYKDRIDGLKDKRVFLTKYGLSMGILTVINSILLMFKAKRIMIFSSLFVIISPLSIFLEPLFSLKGISLKISVISIITLMLCVFFKGKGLKWLSIIFLGIIYFDALISRFLLNNSLLSYEPALGARYYGIGNEFLGVIIAYILIFIIENKSKYTWMIWFINAIILLYDGAGSNFGGFLTCGVIGFFISPFPFKVLELLAAVVLISASSNHIGIFFRNLVSLNFDYIKDSLFSKLYTVKRLLKINIWTEITVTSILIFIFILLRGKLKLNGNTTVFVISCILVVLFNDSGIVSCALIMMIYLNYIFYSLSMEEEHGIY